jgi:hypothetical protein
MSIPVAKGTPVSRAGRLIVQILPGHRCLKAKNLTGLRAAVQASMAHGRQFMPGAGGTIVNLS